MDRDAEQKCKVYMKDCGCNPEQAEEYLKLASHGSTKEQIFFMKRHRNQVMNQLHTVTRQIDCIDFVIHALEQEVKTNG